MPMPQISKGTLPLHIATLALGIVSIFSSVEIVQSYIPLELVLMMCAFGFGVSWHARPKFFSYMKLAATIFCYVAAIMLIRNVVTHPALNARVVLVSLLVWIYTFQCFAVFEGRDYFVNQTIATAVLLTCLFSSVEILGSHLIILLLALILWIFILREGLLIEKKAGVERLVNFSGQRPLLREGIINVALGMLLMALSLPIFFVIPKFNILPSIIPFGLLGPSSLDKWDMPGQSPFMWEGRGELKFLSERERLMHQIKALQLQAKEGQKKLIRWDLDRVFQSFWHGAERDEFERHFKDLEQKLEASRERWEQMQTRKAIERRFDEQIGALREQSEQLRGQIQAKTELGEKADQLEEQLKELTARLNELQVELINLSAELKTKKMPSPLTSREQMPDEPKLEEGLKQDTPLSRGRQASFIIRYFVYAMITASLLLLSLMGVCLFQALSFYLRARRNRRRLKVLFSKDPRLFIIRLYEALVQVLEILGVVRLRWMAPREYLSLARSRLSIPNEDLEVVTGIFLEARYSLHKVAAQHAAKMLEAYNAIMENLKVLYRGSWMSWAARVNLIKRIAAMGIIASLLIFASIGYAQPAREYSREGLQYFKEGRFADAVDSLEAAHRIEPANQTIKKDLSAAYSHLAKEEASRENWEKSVEYAHKAQYLDQDNEDLGKALAIHYNNWALSLAEDERFYDAVKMLKTSLQYEPQNVGVRENLSNVIIQKAQEAFRTGDSHVAISDLREAIEYNPRGLRAYAAIADIYYKQDDYDNAIAYLKKALEVNPDSVAIKKELQRLEIEQATERRFTRKRLGRFVVKFEGYERADLGEEVLNILRKVWPRIDWELNFYSKEPIIVILYTSEQYKDVTDAFDWSAGIYDGRIRVRLGDFLKGKKQLTRVVIHEYTHAVIEKMTKGNIPWWLNEGLAQYEEPGSGFSRNELKTLQETLRGDALIPLKDLNQRTYSRPDPWHMRLAYLQSKAFTQYLIKRFAFRKMRELIQGLGTGMEIEQAMEESLYANLERLEKDWREILKRGY